MFWNRRRTARPVRSATLERGRRSAASLGGALLLLSLLGAGVALGAEEADTEIADLELEDLFAMEVTSLTLSAQRFQDTPAAIFVLTGEDIRRSGVRSIPEALRMVPGLQVARLSGNKWAISARGFDSIFSDKMLVMIDGRTVYTPLFAGVYWDVQDTLLEDIDRIEVIRGPGGTLWGANAVNGVINIVTKRAADTQGAYVSGGGGDLERGFAEGRFGDSIGEKVQYRVYAKYDERTALDDPAPGQPAFDATSMVRAGARIDMQPFDDANLTLQGDFYDGTSDNVAQSVLRTLVPALAPRLPTSSDLLGGNALVRWDQGLGEAGSLMVKAYYDRSARGDIVWAETRDTWDVEFQHQIGLPLATDLSWGGQYRRTSEEIVPGFETSFLPPLFSEDLFTGFLQLETAMFDERLRVLLGSKFIDNDHTGFEAQPSFRFSLNPVPAGRDWGSHTLWGAVTRAVRLPSRSIDDMSVTPTPFPTAILVGNRSAISEIVYAFEAGYRVQPVDAVQLDVAGYYNLYRDVLSLEQSTPVPPNLPLTWRNLIEGDGYGIELSTSWRPCDVWRLRVGYTWAQLSLTALPGSSSVGLPVGIGTPAISSAVPEHQVQVVSTLDLPLDFEFDTHLYYVDRVPLFAVDSYVRLDLRLGWRPTEWLELYASAMNLIEDRHQEWAYEFDYTHTLVPRSFMGGATLRF